MFIVKIPGINGLGKTKGCGKAGNAILDFLIPHKIERLINLWG